MLATLARNDGICELCKNQGYTKDRVRKSLGAAIVSNNPEMVKLFVDNDRSLLEKPLNEYCYPIHYAARCNKDKSLLVLLDSGDNIERRDQSEDTPLVLAAFYDAFECAKLLIERGANVNVAEDFYLYTPLHWAAQFGFVEIAELLINNGARINAVDHEQRTPLHHAAERKKTKIIELLLSAGADVTLKDMWGQTWDQKPRENRGQG